MLGSGTRLEQIVEAEYSEDQEEIERNKKFFEHFQGTSLGPLRMSPFEIEITNSLTMLETKVNALKNEMRHSLTKRYKKDTTKNIKSNLTKKGLTITIYLISGPY